MTLKGPGGNSGIFPIIMGSAGFRTLNCGNSGIRIFLIMGGAGFVSSTVVLLLVQASSLDIQVCGPPSVLWQRCSCS